MVHKPFYNLSGIYSGQDLVIADDSAALISFDARIRKWFVIPKNPKMYFNYARRDVQNTFVGLRSLPLA